MTAPPGVHRRSVHHFEGAFVIHVRSLTHNKKNRLEGLTTRILEQSKHVGADACEVAASASVGLDVQARLVQRN